MVSGEIVPVIAISEKTGMFVTNFLNKRIGTEETKV